MKSLERLKHWANLLNNRQYHKELTTAEKHTLCDEGIVVVFGYSDDIMVIQGYLDNEYVCYNGRTFYFYGRSFWYDEQIDDLIEGGVEIDKGSLKYIKAIGSATYLLSNSNVMIPWTYDSNIPHENFTIMEDDEIYCVGMLFFKKDLKA